jgi:DNA-binding beta-propeller fold protein YncE
LKKQRRLLTTLFTGLSNPRGVAVDASGNWYVADYGNKRIVKNGSSMYSWSDRSPMGVAVDTSGNLYAVTQSNNFVLKYDGSDWVEYNLLRNFEYPKDIAVDSYGNIYVSDEANYNQGIVKKAAGRGELNGKPGDGTFYSLEGIFVDAPGNVYVAYNNNIKELRVGSTAWTDIGGGLGISKMS